MKKEYLNPTIKMLQMKSEPLMDPSVTDEEITEEFEPGAKDMDLDDFNPVFTNKSVWDD
ncbi:MAG: hypothetical protein IKW78_07495 [Prevotella sp.]|nr:hypothetical protein [Prevotella sp.]